ncbi:VOC family protein (plasmid) [Tistrella mobilis]|uniref:VOC family protein n=1 Tax=Tistrella mobilis TaxID=171437 RepID=UPI00355853AF
MTDIYRDLRYLRVPVEDLDGAEAFATGIFGLQPGDHDDANRRFRSDARNYAICYTAEAGPAAVALTVAHARELDEAEARLEAACPGLPRQRLDAAACAARQIKAGLSVIAPNGVVVEIVWRPLTSGWRYHGSRDAGITGLQSVQIACTDPAANEDFWTRGIGAEVSDWAGDAVFLRIDDAHHRIALYPSDRDGLLGAVWEVDGINAVMQGWYLFQARQVPVVHGPGRQPTSGAMFVTARGPGGLLHSYAHGMERGAAVTGRGPRQFADAALSHCAWGSPCTAPEFLGKDEFLGRDER